MNCPLTLLGFKLSFHHQYLTLSLHVYPSKLTCLTLSSQGLIFPASEISSTALPQSMSTYDVKVTAFESGSSKRVHLSIGVLAQSNIAHSGPVAVFRLNSIAGQIPCRGISVSPTGLELLTPDAVALRMPSGEEYCPTLDDGNVRGL